MLEIDSDEIKVNAGLTAWQQAVANVKAPVFEEPKEGIWEGPAWFIFVFIYWTMIFSIPDKQTSEKDDKKLKIVIIILCLLVLAALLPAYLKGLYPDKL